MDDFFSRQSAFTRKGGDIDIGYNICPVDHLPFFFSLHHLVRILGQLDFDFDFDFNFLFEKGCD